MRIRIATSCGLLLLLNVLALGQESSPTPSPSAVQADTSQIPKDYEMLEESASPNGRFAVLSAVRNEKSDEENGPPYPSNLLVRLNPYAVLAKVKTPGLPIGWRDTLVA